MIFSVPPDYLNKIKKKRKVKLSDLDESGTKILAVVTLIICLLILAVTAFFLFDKGDRIIKTYEVTDPELVEEYFDKGETVTMVRHYKLSNGTWKTDTAAYQYRLVISGRMNNAAKDSTFVYLSNIKDISFDQAWKAAGLSSNSKDYFSPSEAVLVGMK